MKKIIAIYNNFFTANGSSESVGGIQTYLRNLLPFFVELGFAVELHQMGSVDFERDYKGVHVTGHVLSSRKAQKQDVELYQLATKHADHKNDILLFATTTNMVKNDFTHSLAIQHGITWDVPKHKHFSHKRNLIQIFLKSILAYKTISEMDKVKNIVCVDYNYINWYRTQVAYPDVKMYTIPNFTDIPDSLEVQARDHVSIIFARRMQEYRGTRLFADVAKALIMKHPTIFVILAGTGSDEQYMHDKLDQYSQVTFITYNSEDSLRIHRNIDIAVVPTLGSEGTSLSLLEAMAAGCVPVATNVGGMVNILLNGYNGYIVNPDFDELFNAIDVLIQDEEKRKQISEKAYETVKASFSIKRWKEEWKKVVEHI